MRSSACIAASAALVSTLCAAAPAAAATTAIGQSALSIGVDLGGLFGQFGQPVLGDGSVRGSLALAACDGSVRPAAECAGLDVDTLTIGFEGSVFPFIEGAVSFLDAGAPTALTVTFGLLIPVIAGPAVTVIGGSVASSISRNPGTLVTTLGSGAFIDGSVGSTFAAGVGDGEMVQSADGPVAESYGPIAGTFDCAALRGCDFIIMSMGLAGRGEGEQYTLTGRFDLDPAPLGVIPLPAPVALLAGALAALGVAARRRA